MPPKKSKAATAAKTKEKLPSRPKEEDNDIKAAAQEAEAENNDAAEEPAPESKAEPEPAPNTKAETNGNPKKRKTPPTASKPPKKEPRQGTRTSTRNDPATTASSKQLLNFLLSRDSLPYCYPSDELDAATADKKLKSYSLTNPGSWTPFEHLLIAHLLSKPLSHTLGMRSIRTLLNPPYSLNTPERIVEAGEKRVWEALEAARTQHRQKTAAYIYQMAEQYSDGDTMFALAEAANDEGHDGVVSHIQKGIKGMGVTGAELFCRRIQCVDGWGEAVWPYSDKRCLGALKEIGVDVADADELQSRLEREVDWSKVEDMGLNEKEVSTGELASEDMELQVQAEFVVVLERAVGAQLEKKIDGLKKAAAEWK